MALPKRGIGTSLIGFLKAQLIRTIEADELAKRAGYSRPHTVHGAGPEGIYVSALADAGRQATGRRIPHGPWFVRRARPMGT